MLLLNTIASVPPALIATAITLVYIYFAAQRWQLWMLGDAALLAVYVWRPSLGMLALLLLLLSVRHVGALARETAVLFQLDSFDGWTGRAVLFLLPALRAYVAPAAAAALPAATGATTVLPASAVPTAPLQPAEWLQLVNDDPTAPHLGVIGATRLGKTTFVQAVLGRRADRLIITTPKDASDPWDGAEVTRLGYDAADGRIDWSAIEGAITSVHREMIQRYAAGRAAEAEPLTLVIDELSMTIHNTDRSLRQKLLELWSVGAGARIRVIVCDPETNARAWQIEGRRDILANLIFAQVLPGRRWSLGRLDMAGRLIEPRALMVGDLLAMAGLARLAGRCWPLPVCACAEPAEGGIEAPHVAHTHTHTHTADKEARIAVYVEWRRAGVEKETARAIRKSLGGGMDDHEWAEAGRILKEETP